MKGQKWILTTGSRFIQGQYETKKTSAVEAAVQRGDVIYDIGAHVGYFSLIMAQEAGPDGHVYSFEPRALNFRFLKKHIRINEFSNISTFPYCVGESSGQVRFNDRTGTGTGHVSEDGDLSVDMISIDGERDQGLNLPPPNVIKIDVEGGERDVLKGTIRTIKQSEPTIILAVHSEELESDCRDLLEPMGYVFSEICQDTGDKELVCAIPLAV